MKNQETVQIAHQSRLLSGAKARVEFRIHLIAYVVINSLLAIINIIFTPSYFWFIWPLMGWGIGIVLHRREVNLPPKQSLMNRLIEKEKEKLQTPSYKN